MRAHSLNINVYIVRLQSQICSLHEVFTYIVKELSFVDAEHVDIHPVFLLNSSQLGAADGVHHLPENQLND